MVNKIFLYGWSTRIRVQVKPGTLLHIFLKIDVYSGLEVDLFYDKLKWNTHVTFYSEF